MTTSVLRVVMVMIEASSLGVINQMDASGMKK